MKLITLIEIKIKITKRGIEIIRTRKSRGKVDGIKELTKLGGIGTEKINNISSYPFWL
jgi:hypothetical protein